MADPTFDDLIPAQPAGAQQYGDVSFDDLIPAQPAGAQQYGDVSFDDLIPAQPAGAQQYGNVSFDDLIPAQPAAALQDAEPSFDDLIPNQGAPWWPSSSSGAVQESQSPQQTPNGRGGSTDVATPPLRWRPPGLHYFGVDGEYGPDGVGNSIPTAIELRGSASPDVANTQAGTAPVTVQEVVVTAPRNSNIIDDSPANIAEDLWFVLTHPTMSLAYARQSASDAVHSFASRFEGGVHNIAEDVDQLPGQINDYTHVLSSYLNGVAHNPAAAVQAVPGEIAAAASQFAKTLSATGPNITNGVDSEINTYGAAWRQGGAHDVLVRAAGDLGAAMPVAGLAGTSFVLPELSELDAPAIAEMGDTADVALNSIARQFPTVDRCATGIEWGKGIQAQGEPWEAYLAGEYSKAGAVPTPAKFKTWDLFNWETGEAISAKTLDTTTPARSADPLRVYYSLKSNIDDAANFSRYAMNDQTIRSDMITMRTVEVAVPEATTAAQWGQIQRAINYASGRGVNLVVTIVK